jgi:hypothetical protein
VPHLLKSGGFLAPSSSGGLLHSAIVIIINEPNRELRAIQLGVLNGTIFNSVGQSKILGHSHSPVPFGGGYLSGLPLFRTGIPPVSFFTIVSRSRFPILLLVLTQTSSEFMGDAEGRDLRTQE